MNIHTVFINHMNIHEDLHGPFQCICGSDDFFSSFSLATPECTEEILK